MRAESTISPNEVSVEAQGAEAYVRVCTNITEETREGKDTIYIYDEVAFTVPYREGLEGIVRQDIAGWIAYAKNQNAQVTKSQIEIIQEIVDQLLIDNLGV